MEMRERKVNLIESRLNSTTYTINSANSVYNFEVQEGKKPESPGFFNGVKKFRTGDYVTWRWANFFRVTVSKNDEISLEDCGSRPDDVPRK